MKMNIMAYTPPTNGKVMVDNVLYDMGQDFRTKERYQEYKDCGFEVLMQAGETKYQGEPFETSDLKYMMDLALETGLKFLVYDQRILDIAANNTYGENDLICGRFSTQSELNDYITACMKSYMNHPAFYGVIIGDEPPFRAAYNLSNVCAAIYQAKKDTYIHNCFLPSKSRVQYLEEEFFPEETDITAKEAFRRYIRAMISTGIRQFDFDAYPFCRYKGKNNFSKVYLWNLQVAAETTRQCETPFYFTIQSFDNGPGDGYRKVDEDDLLYQANVAMGFGAKQIAYYTYWRFQTREKLNGEAAIMDDDGTRLLYDEAKATNAYIQRIFPYIRDYQYVKTQLVYEGRKPRAFTNVKSRNINFIAAAEASEILMINELQNGREHAYMIFNAEDSGEKRDNQVKLLLKEDVSSVRALVKGKEVELIVKNRQLKLELSPGEAIWILRSEKLS